MLVPSPRMIWLVAAGLLIAILGAVIPGFFWILIPYNAALLGLFLWTGHLARRWDVFRAERRTDPVLSVRVPNLVRLTLFNEGNKPVALTVRDGVPASCVTDHQELQVTLGAGEERERTYTVLPQERGVARFEGPWIRYNAPLGLAIVQKRLDADEDVPVYPNVQALKEYDLLKQRGAMKQEGVRKTRIRGFGTEFESLRDYNDDDIRFVDWKASARRGRLIVRNYETERNQSVVLCLDIGRNMLGEVNGVSKLDYALDAALMLMHAAVDKGDQVGLIVFNDFVQAFAPPKKGRAQVAHLLSRVHDRMAEPVKTDMIGAMSYLHARYKRRSLVVVFTDAEDATEAKELAAALAPLRNRHLVFVVRVSDPNLRELRALRPTTVDQLQHRAAALWYARERSGADSVLTMRGVQNIDAEPQELSTALVTAYLNAKERALI